MAVSLVERMDFYREKIDAALERAIPVPVTSDLVSLVREAMRYSLLSEGKRVRPMLTLAFCELCGGEAERALPFACAVEMVHTYSLIHDDLPCMDDDDLRRGNPTNHKVYGESIALLAGDGLLTKAFEIALSVENHTAAVQAALILARCAGDAGMVGGQCADLTSEGGEVDLELLRAMDMGKTVALIDAACRMGCVAGAGGEQLLKAAGRYAEGLGMAFQIRDDILDVRGDAERLGKNVGMDSIRDKRNYVSLLGVEKAQSLVDEYTVSAVAALDAFSGDTSFLRELALILAQREN